MLTKGKINQMSYGLNGGLLVTFELEANLEELRLIQSEELSVDIKKYRKRRSLDANAYFHVLVAKIAEVVKISNATAKNMMIARYGQPLISNGKIAYITTQIEPDEMNDLEYLHTKLVNVRDKGLKTFYTYMTMRGSHTYDTKEMARLIDGTIQEAKDLNIETLPPYELERMMQQWKPKNV